jgi:hypothetical protein
MKRASRAVSSGATLIVISTLATVVSVNASMKQVNITHHITPEIHSGRPPAQQARRVAAVRDGVVHGQREAGEEAAPEGDLEALRGLELARDDAGSAPQQRDEQHAGDGRRWEMVGVKTSTSSTATSSRRRPGSTDTRRGRVDPGVRRSTRVLGGLRRFARRALAVVLLQVALADADRLRRDLHQFVVGDELDRVLERQLDRRRDLDRVFLARDAEVGQLLARTGLTTRSLSREWMPITMPS